MLGDEVFEVAALGELAWFLWRRLKGPDLSAGPQGPAKVGTQSERAITRTITRTLTPVEARASAAADPLRAIEAQLISTAAPSLVPALAQATRDVGTAIQSTGANPIAPDVTRPSFATPTQGGSILGTDASEGAVSPLARATGIIGGALQGAADFLGSVNPLAGVFAVNTLTGGKFRGQSDKQQASVLGSATLKTADAGLSAFPVLGQLATLGLNALAGTGTGKKVVAAVGQGEEAVYNAQKKILAGDVSAALSGGGSSHADRVAKEAADVAKARANSVAASAALGGRGVLGPGGEVDVSYSTAALVTKAQAAKNAATNAANATAAAKQAQVSGAALAKSEASFAKSFGGVVQAKTMFRVTIKNPDWHPGVPHAGVTPFVTITVPASDPRAKLPGAQPV